MIIIKRRPTDTIENSAAFFFNRSLFLQLSHMGHFGVERTISKPVPVEEASYVIRKFIPLCLFDPFNGQVDTFSYGVPPQSSSFPRTLRYILDD